MAITKALALLGPANIDSLSASGRINALYFLTRTAPLAWDPALAADGREVLEFIRSRGDVGVQTAGELDRLARLLEFVRAGEAVASVGK